MLVLSKLNGTKLTEGTQLQQELVPITAFTWEWVVATAQLSAIIAEYPNLKKYPILLSKPGSPRRLFQSCM